MTDTAQWLPLGVTLLVMVGIGLLAWIFAVGAGRTDFRARILFRTSAATVVVVAIYMLLGVWRNDLPDTGNDGWDLGATALMTTGACLQFLLSAERNPSKSEACPHCTRACPPCSEVCPHEHPENPAAVKWWMKPLLKASGWIDWGLLAWGLIICGGVLILYPLAIH
jgi:hypothetical protein